MTLGLLYTGDSFLARSKERRPVTLASSVDSCLEFDCISGVGASSVLQYTDFFPFRIDNKFRVRHADSWFSELFWVTESVPALALRSLA